MRYGGSQGVLDSSCLAHQNLFAVGGLADRLKVQVLDQSLVASQDGARMLTRPALTSHSQSNQRTL